MGNPDNTFPWGPEWNDRLANIDESHLSRTTAVGMYPLGGAGGSPDGVQDLAGNVWEWCLKKYDNPDDNSAGGVGARLCRGGSWYNGQVFARASYRHYYYPDLRHYDLGFRLCCESPIA